MKHTVIFDMDGLLINSEPFWEGAMLEVYNQIGIHLNQEDYRKTTGLPTHEIVEQWSKIYDHKGKSLKSITDEIVERTQTLIIHKGT